MTGKVMCFAFLVVVLYILMPSSSGFRRKMVGGIGPIKPAPDRVKKLALRMKESTERKLNQKFEMFKAVKYGRQVNGGTNYFIKVQVGKDSYVHLRVHQPVSYLGLPPTLSAAIGNMSATDYLEIF